jgi:hypothetical protein
MKLKTVSFSLLCLSITACTHSDDAQKKPINQPCILNLKSRYRYLLKQSKRLCARLLSSRLLQIIVFCKKKGSLHSPSRSIKDERSLIFLKLALNKRTFALPYFHIIISLIKTDIISLISLDLIL